VRAQASCFGAGTIVNAIAIGRGAAFGLALRVTATAETKPEGLGVRVYVPGGLDPALVRSCAERVMRQSPQEVGMEVTVTSEIPVSRGLKSSSRTPSSSRALAPSAHSSNRFRSSGLEWMRPSRPV